MKRHPSDQPAAAVEDRDLERDPGAVERLGGRAPGVLRHHVRERETELGRDTQHLERRVGMPAGLDRLRRRARLGKPFG